MARPVDHRSAFTKVVGYSYMQHTQFKARHTDSAEGLIRLISHACCSSFATSGHNRHKQVACTNIAPATQVDITRPHAEEWWRCAFTKDPTLQVPDPKQTLA